MKAKFITGLLFGSLITMIASKNMHKINLKKKLAKKHNMMHAFKFIKTAVKL